MTDSSALPATQWWLPVWINYHDQCWFVEDYCHWAHTVLYQLFIWQMFMSRGQKLAFMSKTNGMPQDYVSAWVDKSCGMVSQFFFT